MGKIVFLNIDGTIRDFDGIIPDSAIKAIHMARENGHKVCISTGRTYTRIDKEILDIGFDGIISSSGGYVEYEGECISHRYFTQLAYIELMNDLLLHQCVVEIETGRESYVLSQDMEAYLAIRERMYENPEVAKKGVKPPVPIESVLDVPEVEKMVVFSNRMSGEDILAKWGYSFHIVNLSVPYEEKWAGEITPDYINKSEGIRQILLAGDYTREDSIAIGDNDNDLEMIRYAGIGVAMGNGTAKAREAADYIADSIDEDGLWKAFVHLGLIDEKK